MNAALKKGEALKRSASWTWKAVSASPTIKVTVATSAHLKTVSSFSYHLVTSILSSTYFRFIGLPSTILTIDSRYGREHWKVDESKVR